MVDYDADLVEKELTRRLNHAYPVKTDTYHNYGQSVPAGREMRRLGIVASEQERRGAFVWRSR